MRILAIAILLLLAGARSEAQLVSNERTTSVGTLAFTSSVALVDDEKILETVVRVTNRGRDDDVEVRSSLTVHVCRAASGAEESQRTPLEPMCCPGA